MLPVTCPTPSPTIYFTPLLKKGRNVTFRTVILTHNGTKIIVFINHETSNSHRRDLTFHSIPLQIRRAEFSPHIDKVYLLTAIGLPHGGSSTVHIYIKQYIEQHKWHKQYTEKHNSIIRKNADRAPSLEGIPWHLLYNWGKSVEKTQSG
jgi:hypothetical protein